MGMTLYSCITPIAQMSRKYYYLRAKVSGCCCLVSIDIVTRVSLVNIRLMPFQHQITPNFYAMVSQKINASINKPNKARLPSLNPKQSVMSPMDKSFIIYVKC